MKNINIIGDKDLIQNNPFEMESPSFVGTEVAEYFFACYGKDYSTNIMMEEYLNNENSDLNLLFSRNTMILGVD